MTVSDQALLAYIDAHPGARRDDIRRHAAPEASNVTLWRALKRLVDEGRLEVTGKGPATGYSLAGPAVIRAHLQTPYNARPPVRYNREFIDRYVPGRSFYLPADARAQLLSVGTPALPGLPAGTYAQHILERLLIDLSFASSRMEGNTYDILQTERLIRLGEEPADKDRREAVMILNHKEAIQHIVENLDAISITRGDLCDIHALLANGLLLNPDMAGRLRRMAVGISYSSYRPLDDPHTIEEEFDILIEKAATITDPFEQSFFLLVHIPYLQAFDDINKRTSRLAANIPLLKADLAPMSFLTMDDKAYIDGLIGIYELGNVSLLRQAYIDAYLASAENYRVLRAELESPEKAALAYRDFVRQAVRSCVLERKAFSEEDIIAMAADAGIPDDDRQNVADYVRREFEGLHEGNIIRYRLKPADLADLRGA